MPSIARADVEIELGSGAPLIPHERSLLLVNGTDAPSRRSRLRGTHWRMSRDDERPRDQTRGRSRLYALHAHAVAFAPGDATLQIGFRYHGRFPRV